MNYTPRDGITLTGAQVTEMLQLLDRLAMIIDPGLTTEEIRVLLQEMRDRNQMRAENLKTDLEGKT